MCTLIIDCSGFPLEHSGYVMNESAEVVQRVQLLASEIAGFAAQTGDIKKIALSGPTDYCLGIKEEISKQLALEYAFEDIEIEVL